MKRVISFLLVLVMILACVPASVFAALNAPVIRVDSTYAQPGSTVSINILVENNPGIVTTSITCSFDEGLTLVGAEAGDAFSALSITVPAQLKRGEPMTGSANFNWFVSELDEEDIKDGTILTLRFQVADNVELDKDYAVKVTAGQSGLNDGSRVTLETENGYITMIDYTPGDVDDSGEIDMIDVLMLCQYIVDNCQYDEKGYAVHLKDEAANVDGDEEIGMLDVLSICRYIVDGCITDPLGYNIVLSPAYKPCQHSMTATKAKAATCTENGNIAYWYCEKCDKYFSDAEGKERIAPEEVIITAPGHDVVIDEAVPATYTSTGLTQGSHCSVCHTILVAQEVIPVIPRKEHAITYDLTNGDSYLAKTEINNGNPSSFAEEETIVLKNLSVPGYQFLGWYDGAGDNATQIKTIAAGTKYDVELVAHWKKIEYKVQFKSSLFLEENELTYTVDTGVVLPTPKLSNYVFVGWTNEDGKLYNNTMIPVGTTGNIVLTANWTSERNKTWTKDKLDEPIVHIDEKSNTILLAYEIGEIQNVPLYTIKDFGYIASDGITKTETATYAVTISESSMQAYTRAVASATTESSNWTMAKEWNAATTVNEQWCQENGYTKEEAETIGKSNTDTWNVSNGSNGSTDKTVLETNQAGLQQESKINAGGEVTVGASYSVGLDAEGGWKASSATGGLEGKVGISSELEFDASASVNAGVEKGKTVDASKLRTESTVKSSGWNHNSSYGGSSTSSSSITTSSALSEKICSTYGYGSSYTSGETSSNSQGLTSTQSSSDEYASSVTYSKVTEKAVTNTWTTQSTKAGYHRWVVAGTAHVFGVVGYDMSTESYFVYTYSIIDDETYEFEDYSYTSANYNDEQNGVISFEIPYAVSEYVAELTCYSDGLKVDQGTGMITGYTGIDPYVVIPEYMNVGNGKVVKVTGIAKTAFSQNSSITAVHLSDYITEIPDNAFKGCSSLLGITGGTVTEIGDNAFAGCTAIDICNVNRKVTSLGKNSFKGVGCLQISSNNSDVAISAASSGAKKIRIFVGHIAGGSDSFTGKSIAAPSITESIEFNGDKQTYTDVALISDAGKTVIKEATFVNTNTIPVKISSPEVEFDDVTVKATGIAMVLSANSTNVGLQGTITVQSENTNALLCKNLSLYETNPAVDGKLSVIDKILVCGTVSGKELLSYNAYETIDLTTFNNLLNSYTLYFDLDGGTCSETSRKVANSVPIGELPTPTKDYYTFDGWYLADGKTKATAATVFSTGTDQTLYAHWTQNSPSDWVKKSEMPADAELISTKWTYTYRDWKTGSSSTMSGYTRDDSKTTYTINWNGTVNYYDSQQATSETYRYVGTRSVENGTETYLYLYFNYSTGLSSLNPKSGFTEVGYWVPSSAVYQWNPFSSSSTIAYTTDELRAIWNYPMNKGDTRTAYKTQYGYQSGTKVYTYYFYQDQQKESTTYPTGSNISNIVEWVQYRAK